MIYYAITVINDGTSIVKHYESITTLGRLYNHELPLHHQTLRRRHVEVRLVDKWEELQML